MAEEYSTDAPTDPNMTYIVSLSGGTGSAMAAERALQRYGKQVRLWFSDVRHEDEDLYRFMQDTAKRWWQLYGVRLYIHRNQRNPLVVAEQKVIIPNERRAPCSHEREDRAVPQIHCRAAKAGDNHARDGLERATSARQTKEGLRSAWLPGGLSVDVAAAAVPGV